MAESTKFVSSPPRSTSTSVMARVLSATPVTNSAGVLERNTPTVIRPCWLSSAMVIETRMLEPNVSIPFFQR